MVFGLPKGIETNFLSLVRIASSGWPLDTAVLQSIYMIQRDSTLYCHGHFLNACGERAESASVQRWTRRAE